MPELTITVGEPWPKHRTQASLKKAIFLALMAAGRQPLLMAFAALEGPILAIDPDVWAPLRKTVAEPIPSEYFHPRPGRGDVREAAVSRRPRSKGTGAESPAR